MFNLLAGLKDYFKRQEIIIDNPIFRIHCSFTTALLVSFSMIISWTQYFGHPIDCNVQGMPTNFFNSYCWMHSTFTMPEAFYRPPSSVAHPGVANNYGDTKAQKHYTYYQWVVLVLSIQAVMCYFPKWLWKNWENSFMKTLASGLKFSLGNEEEKNQKKSILVDYLIKNLNQHNFYAFRYWFCEALCFVNIVVQMFFMDWFFKGDFMTYGLNVLFVDDTDQEERYDHMAYVFPRVTKCTFKKFGPSGSIIKIDGICILPLNIINEKIYIFLWFWYIILAILTGIVIVFRIVAICVPKLRPQFTKNLPVGDWWILYILGQNIDPKIYKDVIAKVSKKKDETDESKTV